LARLIFPGTIQTPALDILDQALVDAENGKQPWLIFSMPPQEGKSERVSRFFPVWCLVRDPSRRIAIASYADDIAMRWGRQTRDDIAATPDIGLAVHPGISASKEWQLDGYRGGIVTTGVGGALTGRPVDVLVVDDPFKDREEAESPTMRERVKNFWRSKASTRLPEKSIVVIIMTRWHEDDLAGWLMKEMPQDFRLINIPARAEHVDGKHDCKCAGDGSCLGREVLGRQPGEYMVSARARTVAGWEQKERNAGTYDWNALYQGHPSPAEGGIFKRHHWRIHERPRAVQLSNGSWFVPGADEVMISVDAAFKELKDSDYVAMTVWARRGARLDLVDIDYGRMEFTETCARLVLLCAKWPQATLRLIEDKANGPAVISQLRLKVGGLVPYTPVDSKLARARAVSPFQEAGDIGVPDPLNSGDLGPKVAQFIEQCAGFPNAAHDDLVDSFTQAAIRMLGIGTSQLMDELVKELGLSGHEQGDGQTYVDPSRRIDEQAAEWLQERRSVEPMQHWSPQEAQADDADPDDEPWMRS
jgi:predicted phage terminase large subunit-like protein